MGGILLNYTVGEYDLVLSINGEMNASDQCGIAASMGSKIIGLIRRNILQRN